MMLFCSLLLAAAQDPAAGPADSKAVQLEYDDSLRFRAMNGSFEGSLGGFVAVHARGLFNLPEDPRTSNDSFFIRQARIDFQGTIRRHFEYRLMYDFPTSAVADSGTLQDAFVGWKGPAALSLRVGQFKGPFGQEQTTSARFLDFVERSVLDRLVPGRDIGAMLHGSLGDGLFSYEAGVFNGQGRSVPDGNTGKEAALRLRVRPIDGLRLAVAGTAGEADGGSTDVLDLVTPELGVTVLDVAGGSTDELRTRLGLEFSWVRGPWGLRAEYVRRRDRVDVGTFDNKTIDSEAWYLAGSWVLTGDEKLLERRTAIDAPFDPEAGSWGALELVVRTAVLTRDAEVFDLGLASRAIDARGVRTFTAGLNWYPVTHVRVSPNVVYERFESEILLGSDRRKNAAGLLLRLQVDF